MTLSELSQRTLKNYMNKAHDTSRSLWIQQYKAKGAERKRATQKLDRRDKGLGTASEKLYSDKREESIHELRNTTLKSYLHKAGEDKYTSNKKLDQLEYGISPSGDKTVDQETRRMQKRERGMAKATKKLNSEEAVMDQNELTELSQATLHSYKEKAASKLADTMKAKKVITHKDFSKMAGRLRKVKQAEASVTNEDLVLESAWELISYLLEDLVLEEIELTDEDILDLSEEVFDALLSEDADAVLAEEEELDEWKSSKNVDLEKVRADAKAKGKKVSLWHGESDTLYKVVSSKKGKTQKEEFESDESSDVVDEIPAELEVPVMLTLLELGQTEAATEAFRDIMDNRLADLLQDVKQEVANQMFNTSEEVSEETELEEADSFLGAMLDSLDEMGYELSEEQLQEIAVQVSDRTKNRKSFRSAMKTWDAQDAEHKKDWKGASKHWKSASLNAIHGRSENVRKGLAARARVTRDKHRAVTQEDVTAFLNAVGFQLEEAQLHELSKKTLGSYIKKAGNRTWELGLNTWGTSSP